MFEVRTATAADLPTLTTAWHEAAFWRPDQLDRRPDIETALGIAEVRRYLWEPEREGDIAVVATVEGAGVGGAWARRFPVEEPGYGFVDETTPELGVGVVRGWRGRGIGRALLSALLVEAAEHDYEQLSLSVEWDNPSRHLYQQLGWRDVGIVDDAFTMIRPTRAREA